MSKFFADDGLLDQLLSKDAPLHSKKVVNSDATCDPFFNTTNYIPVSNVRHSPIARLIRPYRTLDTAVSNVRYGRIVFA